MEKIVWKDDYYVGIDKIDKQHQGLVNLINRLTSEGESDGMVSYVFDELDQVAIDQALVVISYPCRNKHITKFENGREVVLDQVPKTPP